MNLLPFNPTLSCENKIGPDDVVLIATAVITMIGERMTRQIADTAISKIRFSDICQSGIKSGNI